MSAGVGGSTKLRGDPAWLALAIAFIAIGAVLRVVRYLSFDGFEHDESLLASNFVGTEPPSLFTPLRFGQAAPVGFPQLTRAAVALLGENERAFRLVPLLASVASLPLMLVLARRMCGLRVAAVATALLAICWPATKYATLFKQYSSDLLIAQILLLAAIPLLEPRPRRAWLALYTAVAFAAVWFSHPAVFVIAGVGLTVIGSHLLAHRRLEALIASAAFALPALGFLVGYLLVYRHYAASGYLDEFWQYAFLPFPPRSLGDLNWYSNSWFGLFTDPGGIQFSGLAGVAWLFGVYLMARQNGRLTIAIALPLALVFAAACAGRYPVADRLMLFCLPALLIPIALTLVPPVSGIRNSVELRAIMAFVIFLYPGYLALKYLLDPPILHDARPVLRHVATHSQQGDTLYLHYGTSTISRFYLERSRWISIPHLEPIHGVHTNADGDIFLDELGALKGRPRVWIALSMSREVDEAFIETTLDRWGRRLEEHHPPGGTLLLYDLSQSAGSAASRTSDGSRGG